VLPLASVRAYDVVPEVAHAYARDMKAQLEIEVTVVDQPREAVAACDVVVTAGPILKAPHATIGAGWLEEGAFASLVDFDSYWHAEAFREVDLFCTDDVPQLEHYRAMGFFRHIPPIHADLGELVTGRKPGRQSPRQRTMACNLGLALEDMAVAPLIYRRSLERGLGTWLEL
jgi:ornithine cyclodeaminase/alanine dehydrogenase-like protein (mu-crystallin family)